MKAAIPRTAPSTPRTSAKTSERVRYWPGRMNAASLTSSWKRSRRGGGAGAAQRGPPPRRRVDVVLEEVAAGGDRRDRPVRRHLRHRLREVHPPGEREADKDHEDREP